MHGLNQHKIKLSCLIYKSLKQFTQHDEIYKKYYRTRTNTAKPDTKNNIPDRAKTEFSINLDPILRNLAALDQCVQQLKSFTAILAKTFEEIREKGR